MRVSELLIRLFQANADLDVRVDVGGDVRQIARVTVLHPVLHDGEDIVLIVPSE